ncbi:hypothetical protein [Stutzerimonas kunmingensis]|uniref:hypothetical protein n=1 Tax=Stutzerimonas kunmingensis TaxID=1211807 RepID=UPI0028B1880C|nr:hypothetical protein [Stutzerimonas kunmingensis]
MADESIPVIPKKAAIAQGLKFYFTGKPCVHGHISKRYTSNGGCYACTTEQAAAFHVQNRDRLNALSAKRYAEKRESILARTAERRQREKELFSKRAADYYLRNKDRIRSYNAKWQAENKDRARQRVRERYATDIEYRCRVLVRGMVRRAFIAARTLKDSPSFEILEYTASEMRAHIERQFTKGMSWDKMGKEIHIDHIIPVKVMIDSGITDPAVINALSNLRPMWAKENRAKSDKVVSLL